MRRSELPMRHLDLEAAVEEPASGVPALAPGISAGAARRSLEGRRFDSATHIAVCEDGRLLGVLRIEDLLAGPDGASLRSLMDPEPPVVAPGIDPEAVAWRAVQRGESALAVVDDAGRFRGFVPPHRLLAALLWEHDEDLARIGGFLRDTEAARTASEEPLRRRFWHRLP